MLSASVRARQRWGLCPGDALVVPREPEALELFGCLTALERVPSAPAASVWLCGCRCGAALHVDVASLRRRRWERCGPTCGIPHSNGLERRLGYESDATRMAPDAPERSR